MNTHNLLPARVFDRVAEIAGGAAPLVGGNMSYVIWRSLGGELRLWAGWPGQERAAELASPSARQRQQGTAMGNRPVSDQEGDRNHLYTAICFILIGFQKDVIWS